MKIKKVLIILLSMLGLIDSLYTLIIYNKLIESQSTYKSFCAISDFINCDVVIISKFGKILGIPVSIYGIVLYSCILLFTLIYTISSKPVKKVFYSYMFAVALFITCYSVYLFMISYFVIKALCLMCIGIYVINLSILIIVLHEVIKEKFSPLKLLFEHALYMLRERTVFTIVSIVLIVAIVSLLYFNNLNNEKRAWRERYKDILTGTSQIYNINIVESPVKGDKNAPVTIIEFSDFQCPYCKNADEMLDKIYSDYKDKIRLVFKHFPLDTKCNLLINRTLHENACKSAIASLCAEEQQKFWEYKKKLFENQENLSYGNLIKIAESLGIEKEQFTNCLMMPGNRIQKIVSDINQGYEIGIRSTPTLLLNGKMIKGAVPEWLMREMIERELQ